MCALPIRSEEHTSELQSHDNLVCRLLLEKKTRTSRATTTTRRPHPTTLTPAPPPRARAGLPRRAARDPREVPVLLWPRALFFFKDRAPPESYPLSPRAAHRT